MRFADAWKPKDTLKDKLEPRELKVLSRSYDIVGDIAIIRVHEILKPKAPIVAEAIMKTHKRVKTILLQKMKNQLRKLKREFLKS